MKVITKVAKTIKCRFGCDYPVGIYLIPEGCNCWADPLQALCLQHLEKAVSDGPILQAVDLTRRDGPGWKPRPIQSRLMTPEIARRILTLHVHFGLQGHKAARLEDVNHGRAYEVLNGEKYTDQIPYAKERCYFDGKRLEIIW